MRTVNIIGRRWFQRSAGNTYHSAQIIVDGQTVHKIPYAYGYGNHYMQTAFEWLEENGYLTLERYPKSGGQEAPWRAAERLGFKLEDVVIDVERKKDL